MKKTIVLGASPEPSRYSFKAVTELTRHGYPVIAIGKRTGRIQGVEIMQAPSIEAIGHEGVDTVTMYLNYVRQQEYLPFILAIKPKRVIFNPGAENPEMEKTLNQHGIRTEEACTLVLLGTGQY